MRPTQSQKEPSDLLDLDVATKMPAPGAREFFRGQSVTPLGEPRSIRDSLEVTASSRQPSIAGEYPKIQFHKKGIYMSIKLQFAACAAFATLACASSSALADDHAYSEGQVVNVSRIRTVDGKFDDYMQWLDTVWKQEQEAAKKAGYLLSYEVIGVEARTPDDPDLLLVIRYKNWAALDGALAKGDEIAKQIEGSVAASNQSQADRAKIRRVLGSSTMQVLNLK